MNSTRDDACDKQLAELRHQAVERVVDLALVERAELPGHTEVLLLSLGGCVVARLSLVGSSRGAVRSRRTIASERQRSTGR